MSTCDLPDMYALSSHALGTHIRQIPHSHITTVTYISADVCVYVHWYVCIYTVLLPDDDDWSSDVALLDEDGSIVEAVVADVLEGLTMGNIGEVIPIKYTHDGEYF